MNIRTWQELKALSNNQWPDDECMKEEIAQLRAELSKPVSMEPTGYHIGPDGERRNHYTAAQLAAARQQGAEEAYKDANMQTYKDAIKQVRKLSERIAELEVEVKRTSLTRIQRECLRIGEEVQRAAGELPDGYDIHIEIERGAGAVYLSNPSYDITHFNDTVDGISHCITQAIDAAIAEVKP